MNDDTATLRIVLRRALAADDVSNVPVHFEVAVLDRYRSTASFSLVRTNTVGRLKKEGGWGLDFGIAPDETLIHVFAGDLLRLPAEDREHWASFATALPSSKMILQMRMAPGSCFDDGELRQWD